MFLKSLGAALALALAASAAQAHEYTAGSLTITHPYAYETAPSAMTGAGYIKGITNTGTEADRLIGIKADFPQVSLHLSTQKDGVASMTPVDGIDIPAGGTVELSPGGLHIMFMGLDGKPFVKGTTVPATLIFQKAGEVAVEFHVEARKADGAADDMTGMTGMNHDAHLGTGTSP
jgi:hypothetical protein